MAGGIVAGAGHTPGRRSMAAFALLAAPWLIGTSRTVPDGAAWQGAVVLVAGVLWFPFPRQAIPVGAAAALLSVPLAHAVGPRTGWFGAGGPPATEPQFRTLDTQPTYGPLTDRRTGASMFEVTAPDPGLWRMQTLDEFDGRVWTVSPVDLPVLPQPAVRPETISVRVLDLRNDLVVAPGRIDQVVARGRVSHIVGEARSVVPQLSTGATYQVRGAYLNVAPALLASDRAPLDPRARAYTKLGPSLNVSGEMRALSLMLASFGAPIVLLNQQRPPVDRHVIALARRLAAGTRTEWDKVARVERYLLGGGRFRYTTSVPQPDRQPLADFLLRSHAGYCQQFAGAAALLLRLAGVPARVVAGFATGTEDSPGRYTVRDLDAHEWIEVYFQNYGWVPFNPTPAAAPETVATRVDPFTPVPAVSGPATGPPLGVVLATLAGAAALIVNRYRSRRRVRPLPLERIATRTGSVVGPSTTLSEIGAVLARIGPHTASLAMEVERVRFAPDASAATRGSRMRLARALASDLGALRALLLWARVRVPSRDSGNRSAGQVGAEVLGGRLEKPAQTRQSRGARRESLGVVTRSPAAAPVARRRSTKS
jgi:protein-glutamine gamma-glutamyltransferase